MASDVEKAVRLIEGKAAEAAENAEKSGK